MKWMRRVFRIVCATALAVLVLTCAIVQFQQNLLRWRAERLMADMHRIRLYQSNWADAQSLMHRWGEWGHYDGQCTPEACLYQIVLGSPGSRGGQWVDWLARHNGFKAYSLLGGRHAGLVATFTVKDGAIWRETAGISVGDERIGRWYGDDFPLTLMIEAKSRQRLTRSSDDWWIMGTDEQLAAHPFYKAGRPGGCEINCEEAVITYSTRTPPSEIERLSSFDLSCLTRLIPCTELGQLLPAAREWRLYEEQDLEWKQADEDRRKPCDIPLWAIARDSSYVLAVKGISEQFKDVIGAPLGSSSQTQQSSPTYKKEEATVKIDEILKGTSPWSTSSIVTALPYSGSGYFGESVTEQLAEHLRPSQRYIVFPIDDDHKGQRLTKDSEISLDRCGVQEDTPEVRRELEKGFAQNDNLRRSELR